ncbi:putative B2 protein-like [Capsicum annuum]|uniref:beta-ketoacyl-[acyl-carrier-protein] synthase I n=1 Tax=Capsicum annuum TaxID=4072 RepID=A0A2G2ZUJ9_CAPAN|nr:putative B2 protein-like [Capsicum annuum]KAF3642650.1 putative B2 protein-like [Capsicum annuum]PHT85631.1 hypothetical protein T459_07737 [Capsicum annuum]
MSPYFIPYQITNMGPTLLAINTGSLGPNYSILLACASANCSFFSAANHIKSGDADIMVESGMEAGVTATDAMVSWYKNSTTSSFALPLKLSGLFKILDKLYQSYLIELLPYYHAMESLEHALKRGAPIVAEYLGGAVTCDDRSSPDGLGVSSCISDGLVDMGVFPEEETLFIYFLIENIIYLFRF